MRRLAGWLVVGVALAASAAAAQPFHTAPPEGEGTIRGRLVREGEPGVAAGLEVILYALSGGGAGGLARSVSDGAGRFVFEGVSNDPKIVYLVWARAGEVPFGARAVFAEGQREVEVELRITEPQADVSAVEVGDSSLRIDRGCSTLRVHEVHSLHNPTQRVMFVPEAQRDRRPPILHAELPARATDFATPPGTLPQGLEHDGRNVRFWGPLPPGTRDFEFDYALPGGADVLLLERGFPGGAERVVLLSDARGPRIRGERLHPVEGRRIDGRDYRAVAATGLRPGERLAFSVEIPPAPRAPLGFAHGRIWLELDDAALEVEEEYALTLEGTELLEADSDAPLLCLSLPAGAEALRLSPATLAMGLAPEASGLLALRGPIRAGEPVLSLHYRIPVASEVVSFARRFPRALPLLSILIADTGVTAETKRLHQRRPVRSNDRSYLHLEGFAIEPEERIEIDLARLPAARPLPKLASAGFALLATAGAIAFLIAPLRRREEEPEAGESQASRLAAEREAVYATIRDLDEDFETGKLTEQDYAALRDELRARAVRLLEAERDARAPPPAAVAAELRCPGCGERPPRDARFCPRCGARLATGEDTG